jgi:predicted Ser/Thr protein kinase
MSKCHPEKVLFSKRLQKRGTNAVGAGKYGQISVGCTDLSCKKQIAVKKSRDNMTVEFSMMKKAHKIDPRHVTEPYVVTKCQPVGSIIYYEFINGKTLDKIGKIDKCIVYQVLKTLYKFQKYKFRHNDIHLKNILIEKGTNRVVITDFGISNTKELTMVRKYGIHPNSDLRYDYHMFLNWLYHETRDPFIKKILPKEYLGQTTSKVNNFRLKYGVSHATLPSLRQVLENNHFDQCHRKNLV